MKLNIYSIYDTASGLYSRPFFDQSDAAAKRAFQDLVIDKGHPVGKHPEDYALFRIGIFDDNNAKIMAEDRDCLTNALELLAVCRADEPGLVGSK